MPNIALINGSRAGLDGNTQELLELAAGLLASRAAIKRLVLKNTPFSAALVDELRSSDGFVFGTGTYWDSWGSPLQRFLEDASETEGSDLWLGKPAAVVVTMNSVGGKGVLSRLQGVLSAYGAMIPPMSGMVYSFVNHLALEHEAPDQSLDLWRPEDLSVICHNLMEACSGGRDWKRWPVDDTAFEKKWFVRCPGQ